MVSDPVGADPSGRPSAIAPPLTFTHPLRVEAELANDRDALRGERLIQLHEVDTRRQETRAREQRANRWHRADPHHRRVNAGDRGACDKGTAPSARAERCIRGAEH